MTSVYDIMEWAVMRSARDRLIPRAAVGIEF